MAFLQSLEFVCYILDEEAALSTGERVPFVFVTQVGIVAISQRHPLIHSLYLDADVQYYGCEIRDEEFHSKFH